MGHAFFGEALFLLGTAVIDIHNVHCSIANVGHHINTLEVPQMVSHGGKTLGENICANKINVVLHATEYEIRTIPLQHILLKSVLLLTDPG